ncbi:hypothetical protein SDC9_141253 [bioreactor metagenome]|uniref:Uncharacterized protein n=1 Tax=bioreactor metagenome TaxID=1076179 RepID=A0A645DX61_9ZZZZ
MHQVPAGARSRQRAHRAALDRQVVLARLPPAHAGGHDAGLHAAQARDELEGSLGNVRRRERRRPVPRPGPLWHPRARRLEGSLRRQGPHQPPGLEHLLQLRCCSALPHLGARRQRAEVAVGKVPHELRQILPPAPGAFPQRTASRPPLLQQDAAHAVHHLPDPHGVHRARRPHQDLLPRIDLSGRQVPLLQRWLQARLR